VHSITSNKAKRQLRRAQKGTKSAETILCFLWLEDFCGRS